MNEKQLRTLLDKFGQKFDVTRFDENGTSFVAHVRTQFINNKNSEAELTPSHWSNKCDEWIEKFELATKTNWNPRSTTPDPSQFIYKKVYVCQHNSHNKSQSAVYKKSSRSRDKNCDAKIEIKLKRISRDTVKKEKTGLMKDGLNVFVKIVFEHSHLVDVAQAYSFLRISTEVENQFMKYFDKGGAKTSHEIQLMTDADEQGADLSAVLANGQINPSNRTVTNLYDRWRKENYGDRTSQSVTAILKEKQDVFESLGVDVVVEDNPFTVVIITPLMKRVHNQEVAGEIVFIDSTGSCDQMNTCITLIYCASKAGALPLACILYSSQTTECYQTAFMRAKKVIGSGGFGKKGYPDVIMTDDSAAERISLTQVFPESTLLLCTFHICQAVWRWLWDCHHGIKNDDRGKLMKLFRAVIFEPSVIRCQESFQDLLENSVAKKYSKFMKYMKTLWAEMKSGLIVNEKLFPPEVITRTTMLSPQLEYLRT